MGLELKEQLQIAHIETYKAWELVCKVMQQPFNPHRREICQRYISAVKNECELIEKYTDYTRTVPELRLPFELYYLYYDGAARKKWEKICKRYVERKDEEQ